MTFHRACPVSDLDSRKPVLKKIDGVQVLLALDSSGRERAFANICTHEDKPLVSGRWDPQSCRITCPFHKAIFDVSRNGAVEVGPAVVPLPTFATKRREESGVEWVYVELDDED